MEKSADTSDEEPEIDIMKMLKDVELIGNYSRRVRATHTEILTFFFFSFLVYTLYHSAV